MSARSPPIYLDIKSICQTFKNTILVFRVYLYVFLVSILLHTEEGLNCYLILSLLFLAVALLCSAPLLFPTSSVLIAEICCGLALSKVHMGCCLSLHHT